MNDSKISVIIPCYNQGQYVDEAVESVLTSTFRDFEIVIVNDGSTDEFTNEKLKNYQKEKTRVIHSENRGLPGARNLAIREAKGEYILPLDSDDMIEETYLEKAVDILDQNEDISCVYTWKQKFEKENYLYKPPQITTLNIMIANIIGSSSAIFRRNCWEKVGGYSEDMRLGYEDWEFWIKMIEKEFRFHLIKEPLFLYRVRENSMVSNSNKIENRKILVGQIIEKHPELYEKYHRELLIALMSGEYETKEKEEWINRIVTQKEEQVGLLVGSKAWKLLWPIRRIIRFCKK